jgi:Arc/MetJ-type ribon-helix-helix transcriptional regulator
MQSFVTIKGGGVIMDGSKKLKKATFSLPEPLLDKLKHYVEISRVSSANAAVREAVERYIIFLEEEDFEQDMEKAASDPDFIQDIKDVEKDFERAESEIARTMPKW